MIIEKARHEIFEALKRKIEQISSADPCGTVNMKGYYIHSEGYGSYNNSYFQIYNLYFDSDGIVRADVNYFRNSIDQNVIFGRSLDNFRTDELRKILNYLKRIRLTIDNKSVNRNESNNEKSTQDLFLNLIKTVQSLAKSENTSRNSNDS
jgi:hypothetical protein